MRSSFRSVLSFRVAAAESVPVVSNIPMPEPFLVNLEPF